MFGWSRDEFWFWFGVWTSILALVIAGTVTFTGLVPAPWEPKITKLCADLFAINNVILTAAKLRGYMIARSASVDVAKAAVNVLIGAFVLSLFLSGGAAMAQGRQVQVRPAAAAAATSAPAPIFCDTLNLIPGCKPKPDSTAPAITSDQPCDITILTKLTPANLMATIKKCMSNENGSLADGAEAALKSAKAFTQTGATTPNPDQDAINCLTPATALFRAGMQTPAQPAVPAVPATDTTAAVVAKDAVPAKDPSLILLFEKFSEFELAGGITSCQTWFNRVNNAAFAGAGQAVGSAAVFGTAAAVLAPK